MKPFILLIIFTLAVFVAGYALGRREGKKEGYAEAQATICLIMRQKVLDSLNQTLDQSNIEA